MRKSFCLLVIFTFYMMDVQSSGSSLKLLRDSFEKIIAARGTSVTPTVKVYTLGVCFLAVLHELFAARPGHLTGGRGRTHAVVLARKAAL